MGRGLLKRGGSAFVHTGMPSAVPCPLTRDLIVLCQAVGRRFAKWRTQSHWLDPRPRGSICGVSKVGAATEHKRVTHDTCPTSLGHSIGIVIVGPVGAQGGISSVVESVLLTDAFQRLPNVAVVKTALNKDRGHISKLVAAATALLAFLREATTSRCCHVVHIHVSIGSSFWRKLLFVLVAHIHGDAIVFHLHSGQSHDYFRHNGPLFRIIAIKVALAFSDLVVVLSESHRKIVHSFVDDSRIRVIPNPAPAVARRNWGREADASSGPCRLVFMGRLAPSKGVADLLHAMLIARNTGEDIVLAICGEGSEHASLQHLTNDLGLSKSVTFYGWVSGEEKAHILGHADALVLPSYNEALPMTILEAMAVGLPVVASTVGTIPEIVDDGVTGLLYPPGDIHILARHLMTIARDPLFCRSAGIAGQELARKHDPEVVAALWISAYHEAIRHRTARRQ